MILEYIDNIDQSMVESELDVCAAILEYYDKSSLITEYDENQVFQEAAKTEESLGSKVKNVIARIAAAINKMFNKLVNKLFGGGESSNTSSGDSREVRATLNAVSNGKLAPKKRKQAKKSIADFRKKHPVLITFTAFTTLAGGIYAGDKALDAAGKKSASKGMTETDREWINKHFNPSTHSFKLPCDMHGAFTLVDTYKTQYEQCVKLLESSLNITEDGDISDDAIRKFFDNKAYNRVKSIIDTATQFGDGKGEIDWVEGGGASYIVDGGKDGWNKFIEKANKMFADAEGVLPDIQFVVNIIAEISDRYATLHIDDPDGERAIRQIVLQCGGTESLGKGGHLARLKKINSDIRDKLTETNDIVLTYYSKYYAVEAEIESIKKDIKEALLLAAKLLGEFSKAARMASNEEVNELQKKYDDLSKRCEALDHAINEDKAMAEKKKYDTEIENLKEQRDKLKDEIAKLRAQKMAAK